MKASIKGYTLGAIAAATYGLNPFFAVPLYERGMNADSMLLWRYLLAIPLLGAMMAARGRSFAIPWRTAGSASALGILLALSSLALFMSYNYMNTGIASTLLFVYPLLVALIMAALYREKLSAPTILCMGVTLTGIWLMYDPAQGGSLNLPGCVAVFVSALSYAIYIVAVDRPQLKRLPTLTLTFYVLLAGVTLFAARTLVFVPLCIPHGWLEWGCVAGLALFPTAISFLCTTMAVQYIGSTPTAILGALEPVTAVILGVTALGQPLSVREASGVVLIVLAVTFVIAGGKVSGPLVRFRKMFPRRHRK